MNQQATRVGLMNMQVDLPDHVARFGLRLLIIEFPQLAYLPEWGRNRTQILKDVCDPEWGHARPLEGGGPVVWAKYRYDLESIRAHKLAGSEWVGRLAGRKSRLGPSYATVARFEPTTGDGPDEVLIGFHLTAEVQQGASYRTALSHRLRVRRHKREVRALEQLIAHHKERGRIVYPAGDGNFDGLQLDGVTSCWDGRKPRGTLGNRAVDIVFGPTRADYVVTLDAGSDHRAVVATYRDRP